VRVCREEKPYIYSLSELIEMGKENIFPKRKFVFNNGMLLIQSTPCTHFWKCKDTFVIEFNKENKIHFDCIFDGCHIFRNIKLGDATNLSDHTLNDHND
jgi:hypothetical protein